MCGMVSPASTTHCECGHDFDSVDPMQLQDLYKSRLTNGWFMVVGGLLLTILSVVLFVIVKWLGLPALVASIGMFVKGTRVVDANRANLRALEALPQAKLLR